MKFITNGATITVLSTGKSYHTRRDWGLAMSNNDYLGEPIQETFYLDVPGADGFLDYSEALTGRPIFKQRSIELTLGGKMDLHRWTAFISTLRVLIHGKIVQIVFDDFPGYYWVGRTEVTDFDRFRQIGTFKLSIPKADPYGYSINDNSTENWLWDPFDFEYGIIDEPIIFSLTSNNPTASCTIPHGPVPFIVTIHVTHLGDMGLTMTVGDDNYLLKLGENKLAEFLVCDEDVTIDFAGRGTVQVIFRRRVI